MFLSISDLYNDDYGVDGGDDEDDGATVQITRWGITFRKSLSRNVAPQDLPMSSPVRLDKISTLDLMLIGRIGLELRVKKMNLVNEA